LTTRYLIGLLQKQIMSSKLTYNQIIELLPAYALGALDTDELLAVDAYLQEHQELMAQLRMAEEAVAQLAHTAPLAPLPSGAKASLMARIQADLAGQTAPEPSEKIAPSQPAAPTPTWLDQIGAIFGGKGWAIATGLALVLLAIIGLYVTQLRGQLNQMTGRLESVETELAELEQINAALQQSNQILEQRLQTNQNLLAVIADTDFDRIVEVPGTAEAPDARGILFVSGEKGTLMLQGLSPLPDQQTYQLWLAPVGESAQSAGLLSVDPEETTWLNVSIPPGIQDLSAVGVSIEPSGGSSAPTGPILLHWP
jgi:anti-sigma-K factor RskA